MDSPDASPAQGRAPPRALRVTFAYRDNTIRVVDSQPVEMIAPPAVTPAPNAGQAGYWVAITDASSRVLWHRPLSNPIAADVEGFSDDQGPPVARVPVPRIEGQFSIVVPDVPNAAHLSLNGPPDARTPDAPAGELVRVPIDALRKFAPPGGSGGPRKN
jgi:hypothetical protein